MTLGADVTRSGLFAISSVSRGEAASSSRWTVASRTLDIECAGGFASRLSLVRPLLSMPAT